MCIPVDGLTSVRFLFDHSQRRQLSALLTNEYGALKMAGCQELAENGRVTEGELVGDDRLLTALVSGEHVEKGCKGGGYVPANTPENEPTPPTHD